MIYSKDNLRQIFQQPFNAHEWQQMLQHYFQATELKAEPERIEGTTEDEQGYYLGAIDTTDSYRIGLFYYQIQHGNVARKRVGLRNLVKSFVNPNWGEFDAALVVFDSDELWRLSFVSDIKGESTAPKRYTYVFGENDSFYNTPVGRFDALQRKGISFENIKDAFSVEALSKEFFDEYREHYADIVEYITGKRYVKEKGKWVEKTIHEPCHEIFDQFVAVYKDPEKTVRDYIKKLMGRLVFLQFLQKKDWMGVPADRQDWKSGDTRFLQNKFNEFADKDNFIDGFLEPLFNDLNTNRQSNNDLASPKVGNGIKIPFLNGGLFQLDEEDCSNIRLPQHLLGDVLDFFERYNFTIDENDPNDAQIGVDPEMLGRVFENLLEDNKDKGAFYTPKEIVQYMCQESLIAYLQTGIDDETDKESIRQFVLTHEAEHLGAMAEDISIKLLNVKICDPAIGSGAFPMGLLRQLYLCQCAIHPELEEKNAADIKRHIIQNNIYGVDIEKGAVDIARLRFWLSLIVDEETPRFLPNLDFKIMQGNSLLEQYKGVDLSKMTELKSDKQGIYQTTMFDDMLDVHRLDLRKKLDEYYNCSDHQRKERLKQEIIENVKQQLREQSINVDFGDLDLSANDQFTLWHTWFYDVFSQGGFNIVIGNPPYVDIKGMPKDDVRLYFKLFSTCENRINLYAIFLEKGMSCLAPNGVLCFINPNSMLMNESYRKLRNLLIDNVSLIIKLPDSVFESADVETIIILIRNHNCSQFVQGAYFKNDAKVDFSELELNFYNRTIWKKDTDERFSIFYSEEVCNLLNKIQTNTQPLSAFVETSLGITPYDKAKGHSQETIKHRLFHSKTKDNATYVPLISGKNICPYIITDDIEEYLSYGTWLGAPREKRFFTEPRIVVRQIVGGTSLRIIAGYEETMPTFFTQVGFSLLSKRHDTNELKYLLALLNSKLVSFYHKNKFLDVEKVVFQKVLIANAKQLPIKVASDNVEKILVNAIDKILVAKKGSPQKKTQTIEDEIDLIVYHLYGLTYDEVLIVDPETPITREEYEKQYN